MQTQPLSLKIPARMNSVRLHSPDGPVSIVYEEVETPPPEAGEVLVKVHAAAITRDELDWPLDRLPAIPSYELSGVVVGLGVGVKRIEVGQAVFALSPFNRNGAAAEYITVPAGCLAPKPKSLSHVESAALPLAALTAWQGLLEHGQLRSGQRLLIHGATGGVGLFAVQLARLHGAYIIGTVSHSNIEVARKLGLDRVVDHAAAPFEEAIEQVDLVFDTVGGELLRRSPSIIRSGGRLVSVAMEPSQEEAARRGITAIYFVVEPNDPQLGAIRNLAEEGKLRPMIDRVFPLAEARQAFQYSLAPHRAGKVVLQVTDDTWN